jgi:hypothetical protein
MIKSQLILDVFDLIFDDFEHEEKLRNQIPFLSENEREHTGIGLFINFKKESGIEDYKIPIENTEDKDISGKAIERINGVEMKNNELKIFAEIDVQITDGIIDYIEIWNKIGEDFPISELTKYELKQVWVNSKNRKIIRS